MPTNDTSPLHLCIVSINFDRSPEGICTGRLVRALLDRGVRITLITSRKARPGFTHPNFDVTVYGYRPRRPRWMFRALAALGLELPSDFECWAWRASRHVFDGHEPDLVYGRAWPFGSLVAADGLARRYALPLIAHLSDPIPQPYERAGENPDVPLLRKILDRACRVTFTNPETIRFQSRSTPLDASRCCVLNHVSGPSLRLGRYEGEHSHYGYLGSLGNRGPVLEVFLAGFKEHLRRFPRATLDLIGTVERDVRPVIDRLALGERIRILPHTDDLEGALARCSALVSFEPDVDDPIWTLTKTVDYLKANRPILALTSAGSPTQRMLSPFPESCVVVTSFDRTAIAAGFDRLAGLDATDEDYRLREEAMKDYEPGAVAEALIHQCRTVLSG